LGEKAALKGINYAVIVWLILKKGGCLRLVFDSTEGERSTKSTDTDRIDTRDRWTTDGTFPKRKCHEKVRTDTMGSTVSRISGLDTKTTKTFFQFSAKFLQSKFSPVT
jgi:hypothetical protein